MKNKKYYVALNDREYAEIISSLIDKRNSLIRLGRYTDGVDEVIMKVRKLNSNSSTVVVAVITSARKREDIASHIFLETECGLREPSMVMLEQMRTIDKAEELISYVGKVEDNEIIAKIKDGIRYQFQLMRVRKPIRTGYILSLCPKCRSEFFSVPENILRRVDPLQVEKEPCDKCQVGYGYSRVRRR